MKILGISCYYHDAAACVIDDGRVVAAAQEERFSRIKHDQDFPASAVRYCLAEAGCADDELEAVAFYDKPILKFHRILETFFSVAPSGLRNFMKAVPVWIREKIWIESAIQDELERCGLGRRDKILPFSSKIPQYTASGFCLTSFSPKLT